MFSKLSKREKIMLVIALTALFLGAYYYFLYLPLNAEKESARFEISQLENRYSTMISRVNEIENLEAELEQLISERNEILDEAIRDPEEILTIVNLFASRTGVRITSYRRRNRSDGHGLSFNLNSSYIGFYEFVDFLEDWDDRLIIESFYMNRENNELDISMELFYHQPDDLTEFIEEAGG